ncbi:MAG: diguanylate cyclase, partial [Pyrinomonadaceae bacterium]|nr:diguanylate cyclase [Pyrinomonadaceae bacterium]
AAAVVALRQTRPHIIIADVNLKGITAEELTRMLGRMQEGPPLVLVGGVAATLEQRSSSLAAGAFDYFQVPSELPLLLARAAQLIKLRLTMDRLRAEAERDYLTGLANRRYFRTALGQELERWRRYNVPCALLMLDIDYMKRINDTHGHSAGDAVILHIATALKDLSRDNDTTARLGGEEFALLLAGVDAAKAVTAAERLRHDVSAENIEGIGTVTVSLGVAACPAHATSERSLYAASDAALYRAKSDGRNQTAIAPTLE